MRLVAEIPENEFKCKNCGEKVTMEEIDEKNWKVGPCDLCGYMLTIEQLDD